MSAASMLAPLFPPKKTPAAYMLEWRAHIAKHKSVPVETATDAGYNLAKRVRSARDAGVFTAAQLRELDTPIPPAAVPKAKTTVATAAAASAATHRPSAAKAQRDLADDQPSLSQPAAAGSGADKKSTANRDTERARSGGATPSGVRAASATSQETAEAAATGETKGMQSVRVREDILREGLFFEPQEGAWCGMHALNNYCLRGRLVEKEDCVRAANQVVGRLTEARGGDAERRENHLDPDSGWLSIDVINVLGLANLGLHVEEASITWNDLQQRGQDGAALVNWNKQHWTILQRDPSGNGWMHTNSVEGEGLRYGRRRYLSSHEVSKVLRDIHIAAEDYALHAITHAAGAQGRQFLEAEGWRAMAPADAVEDGDDVEPQPRAASDVLSLMTLNVDGLGEYTDAPATRMDALLDQLLLAQPEPDVLALQEMTAEMLAQLRSRLPDWKICRRRDVSTDYFNITAMRRGSDRTTSFAYPESAMGRHLITTRQGVWAIMNTHAESGRHARERDAREKQLLHISRLHQTETDDQVCFLAVGDFNLRAGEERDLEREGWRDAWPSRPGVDDWTWSRGSSTGRYDRIFLHNAGNGDTVECAQIRRLPEAWPTHSDHVALHAVVRRRPKVQIQPDAPPSRATGVAAATSPASGLATVPASATGLAAAPSSASGLATVPSSASGLAAASQVPQTTNQAHPVDQAESDTEAQFLDECIAKVKELQEAKGKKWFPYDFTALSRLRRIKIFEDKFKEYIKCRIFRWIHHFRGTRDFGLDEAMSEEAEACGIVLQVSGNDQKRDGINLLADEPYNSHLQEAQKGKVDGYHSGYPCTSFSRLRFRVMQGMPGPVRDSHNLYGLPQNTSSQQAEADRGTLMCTRSIDVIITMEDSEALRSSPTVASIENPSDPKQDPYPSSFQLPEVLAWTDQPHVIKSEYNHCAYQSKWEPKHWKDQTIESSLPEGSTISRVCPGGHRHVPIIGKQASEASGAYPESLCRSLARLYIRAFLLMASIEVLSKWRASIQSAQPTMITVGKWGNTRIKQGDLQERDGQGIDHTKAQQTRKERREGENQRYPGGMRNPLVSHVQMPGWIRVGERIWDAVEPIVEASEDALQVGTRFGDKDYMGPLDKTVDMVKEALIREFSLVHKPMTPTLIGEPSPLDRTIFTGLLTAAGDWDSYTLDDWIDVGVPMGIDSTIETNGIFPPAEEFKQLSSGDPDMEFTHIFLEEFENYESMEENDGAAATEFARMLEAKYAIDLPKRFWRQIRGGHVHRMALIHGSHCSPLGFEQ